MNTNELASIVSLHKSMEKSTLHFLENWRADGTTAASENSSDTIYTSSRRAPLVAVFSYAHAIQPRKTTPPHSSILSNTSQAVCIS